MRALRRFQNPWTPAPGAEASSEDGTNHQRVKRVKMFGRSLVTTTEATVISCPTQCALDDIAGAAQPASMRTAARCNQRTNQPAHDEQKEPLEAVTAIALQDLRATYFAVGALHFRNRFDRRWCRLVVALVRWSRGYGQRQATCVDNHVRFAACFAAVRRVWAGVRSPKKRPHGCAVDDGTRPIDGPRLRVLVTILTGAAPRLLRESIASAGASTLHTGEIPWATAPRHSPCAKRKGFRPSKHDRQPVVAFPWDNSPTQQ